MENQQSNHEACKCSCHRDDNGHTYQELDKGKNQEPEKKINTQQLFLGLFMLAVTLWMLGELL